MSIPERLWRVVRGNVIRASEGLAGSGSEASDAAEYEALAEAIRRRTAHADAVAELAESQSVMRHAVSEPQATSEVRGFDPMQASYELLGTAPGARTRELEAAYRARVEELNLDSTPAGSAIRQVLESRKAALDAAYERLRDVTNTTETRFERLEF